MLFRNANTNTIFVTVILSLMILGLVSAQDKVIDLKFEQPPASGSDTSRTLQSLVRVQGTGQFCEDGLYLMTHFGDREELFQKENQEMIDNPLINQTWRHCSLFSSANENSVVMGRNWDNQNVGSIIVSLYHPPKEYSSISFTRSIDLGFGHKDLEQHKSGVFGSKLLLAPFYAFDGINEHGLAAGVAADEESVIRPQRDKELVFITFLIRKILDQTKNVEEAVNLVKRYIPFLLDKNTLAGHLLIVDSSGRSVVVEYVDDQWRTTYGATSWQVLSTKRIYNVSDAALRKGCWRYRRMAKILGNAKGGVDWKAGMRLLEDVEQKGTTWSAIYSPLTKEVHFCVYQQWHTVYHATIG